MLIVNPSYSETYRAELIERLKMNTLPADTSQIIFHKERAKNFLEKNLTVDYISSLFPKAELPF